MDKILIIDDDRELCDLIADFLGRDGFILDSAHDGKKGLEKALQEEYDLIILDIMLPEMNGFEVLRNIRAKSDIPVLMLTARGEDIDKIVGLEMGSDDYLSKPFNTRELSARIKAVLRRASNPGLRAKRMFTPENIQVGEVDLDPGARRVLCSGKEVDLTAIEFRLLEVLLKEAGNIVPRENLSERVLERRLNPYDRSIDVHISRLRKKLRKNPGKAGGIEAIRGVGYIYTLPGRPHK